MTISSTIADGVQRTFSVPASTGTPVVKVNGTVVTWTAQGNNNLVLNSVPAKDAVVTIEYTEQTFKASPSVALTSTRQTTTVDSGAESIYNATASNYTLTVAANTITKPTMVQQESTGTITLAAGAGVTFIGSSLATDKAGSLLSIIPTSTLNKYIIVKGGL